MDEKCSFRARSEMESAETTRPATRTDDTPTAANNNARTMLSPSETITPVKRLIVTEISLERTRSADKPAQKRLLPRVAIHLSNGLRQRNPFGASVHAVLRVGAFLNSPGSHDRREPLALVHRSRGMHIEKPHLADDRRSHELVMLIHLRTNFQAVPARDAI